MVPLPYGYYGSFVSLRAYVTLDVQLPTCVSSPERTTSVRVEFSPTVPVSVLSCFWAGPTWLKFKTDSSTKALCLSPVYVAVSILLSLAWLTMLLSALPVLLGSALNSGFPVFTTICWKGVSFPLGMAIDLISLLWAILHSSHLRQPPLRLRYGPRTKRGKLVRLRRHLRWTLLLQILLRPISPLRKGSSLGSSPRSSLCSLWKVFPVSSSLVLPYGSSPRAISWTPPVSSLHARSRSPCRMKKPLVRLRPREDVSSVVTGAPPGSLSARCVVFTVSPCLIIFPLLRWIRPVQRVLVVTYTYMQTQLGPRMFPFLVRASATLLCLSRSEATWTQ